MINLKRFGVSGKIRLMMLGLLLTLSYLMSLGASGALGIVEDEGGDAGDTLVDGGYFYKKSAGETEGRGDYIKGEIFKDWVLQDFGVKIGECFGSESGAVNEIKILKKAMGEVVILPEGLKSRFDDLVSDGAAGKDLRWRALYVEVCEVRRAERLKPLLDKVDRFVFVKGHPRAGSFYGYTEGQSDAQSESNFRPDSEMCVFEFDGIYGKEYSLLKDKTGVIRDHEVSYDGKRLLFAWKTSHRKDDYHLYEMNLMDGGIRQLTFGKTFSDYEGIYLPGGDIVFSSTRGVSTIECWWTESSNLWRL